MTNKITKTQSTAIATQNNNALDISAFGGFSVADLVPSTLVLIQGNNDLKDKIGAKNGDFVADNSILGREIEFIPISSEFLYDIFKGQLDSEGKITNELCTYESTILQGREQVSLEPLDDDAFPTILLGSDGMLYQSKIVFIIAVKGVPYRLVFKSRPKHISAKNIFNILTKSAKTQGFKDPIEGVFKLFGEEREGKSKEGKKGNKFWSLSCGYVRPASDEELAEIAAYRAIDITKVKEEETPF